MIALSLHDNYWYINVFIAFMIQLVNVKPIVFIYIMLPYILLGSLWISPGDQ